MSQERFPRLLPEDPDWGSCPALLVGHPGHELHIYGWLTRTHPKVFVLTDGGGRRQTPRLSWTTEILKRTRARGCAPYGSHPDVEIYRAVLDGRYDFFLELIETLADAFIHEQITCLVTDPVDGYNPTHDLCRILAGAAVAVARVRLGRPIAGYELVPVTGSELVVQQGTPIIRLRLSDDELIHKLAAARTYAPLSADIEALIARAGENAFRTEGFRPFASPLGIESFRESVPDYEHQGELRVTAGLYTQVIRYQQHIIPLIDHIQHYLSAARLIAA